MASNDTSSPPRGLGQPLVVVKNVHGGGIRPLTGAIASSPVGNNHPLAMTTSSLPPPPPPPPNMSLPQAHAISSVPSQSLAPAVPPAPPTVQISNRPLSPEKKTLDSLADLFLSGPSYRLSELNLPPLLKPPPLPPTQDGMDRLRTLVERRAWGDVLQVSGEMLRTTSGPYSEMYSSLIQVSTNSDVTTPSGRTKTQEEVVEIMTLECHAFLKLRRYVDLGKEIAKWSFCVVNNPNSSHPDWIPWSLQILAAESLQYTEAESGRCIDTLYAIRESVQHDKRYVLAVDSALSNAFLRKCEWRLSLESLDHMLEVMPAVFQGDLLSAYRAEVWSRQGRIFLQVGAISEAEQLFAKTTPPNVIKQHWILDKGQSQCALQEGMVQFARRNYQDAMASFEHASNLLRAIPEPIIGYRKEAFLGPDIWVETPQGLLAQAWNNMGLAALYCCRMSEAVSLMESLVREDPTSYLTERLAFNLCTLYELGADTAGSARKKRVLQLVAKRFYLHDIGPEQFRVS